MRFGLLLLPLLLLSGCIIDDVLGGGAQNETAEEKPPVKISYSSAHVAPAVSGEPEPEAPEESAEGGPEAEAEAEMEATHVECEGLIDLSLALCNANHTPVLEGLTHAEIAGFNVSCSALDKSSMQAGIVRSANGSCTYSWSITFSGQSPPGGLLCGDSGPAGDSPGCFEAVFPGPGSTLRACAPSRESALAEMADALSALYSCPESSGEGAPVSGEPEGEPDMSHCEELADIHRVICEADFVEPVPGLESVTLEKLEVSCSGLRKSSITADLGSSADPACSYSWTVNFRGVKPTSKLQCSSFYIATYTTTCYTTLLPDGAVLHGCAETREGALEKIKEAVSLLETCPE